MLTSGRRLSASRRGLAAARWIFRDDGLVVGYLVRIAQSFAEFVGFNPRPRQLSTLADEHAHDEGDHYECCNRADEDREGTKSGEYEAEVGSVQWSYREEASSVGQPGWLPLSSSVALRTRRRRRFAINRLSTSYDRPIGGMYLPTRTNMR